MWPFATQKKEKGNETRETQNKSDQRAEQFQQKKLLCPRCGTGKVMRKLKKQGVTIDVCSTCKGMWLDHGEMQKLLAMHEKRGGK